MRRVWIGLLAALSVLGAADTLAWYWATARLADGFAVWAEARRESGWTVRFGSLRHAGWPFSAAVVVPRLHVVVAGPREPWPVVWQAEQVVLRVRPRLVPRLSVSAAGRGAIGLSGSLPIPYAASRLVLHLPLHGGPGPQVVTLAVRGLRVGAGARAALALATAELRVEVAEPHPPAAPERHFAIAAHDIVLPPGRPWPLGPRIASVAARGIVRGTVPAAGTPRQRAETFQRSGGELILRTAALRWGPLTASLDATLRLDPALQPEGQGRAMVSGYAQALDTLAANGAMENDTALTAKAVLSLLAAAPRPGGRETIAIPLSLRGRTLSADGLPLLRVPLLRLPSTVPAN